MKDYISPLAVLFAAATIVAALLGLVLIPADATLPIHWGVTGEPDGFAPRNVALLLAPILLLVVWGIILGIRRFGPARQVNGARAMNRAVLIMTSALFLCIAVVILLIGMGVAANMVQAIAIGVGLLFAVLGNAMPKSQPNSFAGLRTRATLSDPANWQATHRLTGMLCIAGGAVLIVAAFLVPVSQLIWWLLACVLVPLLAGLLYSISFTRRRKAG